VICWFAQGLAPALQQQIRTGTPLLVRGVYARNNTLLDCRVMRIGPAAHRRY
jgi:hypothetical protein